MSKSRVETWGSATGATRIPLLLSHPSRVLRLTGSWFPGFRRRQAVRLNPALKLSIPSGDVGTAHVDVSIVALDGQHRLSPGLSRAACRVGATLGGMTESMISTLEGCDRGKGNRVEVLLHFPPGGDGH